MKKIFSIFIFILLLTTNIAIAQEEQLPDPGILPDSPLYGLKKAAEAVGTFFTFGQEKKAERMLQLAEKRLAEAEAVGKEGKKTAADKAIKGYQKAIENAQIHARNAERKAEVLEKVAEKTSKHLSILDKIKDKVPEQVKEAITKAKEASMNEQKKALRALSEDKPEKAAEINIKAAKDRLKRAKEKAEAGESEDVEEALEEYDEMTELSKELAEKDAEAAEDIAEDLNEQLLELDEIEDAAPEDVKEKVKEKKSSSLEKQRDSLRSLAKDKPEKAAEIYSKAAEARLNRAKEKADENEIEEVENEVEEFDKLANFGNEISQIAQGLGKDTTTVDQLVARATTRHLEVLAEVYEKVPEQAKAAILSVIERAMEKSVKGRETAVEALKKKDALGDISEEVPKYVSDKIPEKIKEKIGIKGKSETVGKPKEVAAPAAVPEKATKTPTKKTPEATTKEVAAPEIIPEETTETPTGTLLMQMTDAPPELNITKALVTISDVEVHLAEADEEENATTEAGWFTVVEEAKTFDLIAIEDVKEFLGTAELSVGKYTQIRLNIIEALVTINGTEYDLTIPSKTVKLVKAFNIEPNETTTLTLDFDAQESIHSAGKDKYIMRPTIKVIQE